MQDKIKDLFQKINDWHTTQRQADIRACFELGDLVVAAVMLTGMTEYKVIKRICSALGKQAYGTTTYNRADSETKTRRNEDEKVS